MSTPSITISEIINRVRKLINDVDEVQFTDGNFLNWLSDGVRRIRKARPDTKLDEDGALTTFTEIDDVDDNVPLEDKWRSVLTDYVLYRAFSEMATGEASKNRALQYKQQFNEKVV